MVVEGRGLFGGEPSRLQFVPAPPDSGIAFACGPDPSADDAGRITADISNVAKRARRTSLINGSASVETVEHVLSAVWGMGIDNLTIEVSGSETPSVDGSAKPFVEALQDAELDEQDTDRQVYVVDEPVSVCEGEAMLAVLPGPTDCLDILYDLNYGQEGGIGRQVLGFRLGKDDYISQIAPSRTFLLEREAKEFQARGIGAHLTACDVVVMGEDGPIDNELRFDDEPVRHKICDLIGDLALLGRRLRGRVVAYKSGHELNHELVRLLSETIVSEKRAKGLTGEPVMDIRKIMRLLPHRYPFLMIDRITEIDGDRRIVGMVLEALAQLSGILLSRRLEHTGKVAMLLSMDRVKMRRPVRPGDQLVLEAEALHVRARTGHCRCRATVAGAVAAEAEIKFMLVDAEPV